MQDKDLAEHPSINLGEHNQGSRTDWWKWLEYIKLSLSTKMKGEIKIRQFAVKVCDL